MYEEGRKDMKKENAKRRKENIYKYTWGAMTKGQEGQRNGGRKDNIQTIEKSLKSRISIFLLENIEIYFHTSPDSMWIPGMCTISFQTQGTPLLGLKVHFSLFKALFCLL